MQAGFGAYLVQRFLPTPLKLMAPREIGSFFVLGALVACVVNASVGTAGSYAAPGQKSTGALCAARPHAAKSGRRNRVIKS